VLKSSCFASCGIGECDCCLTSTDYIFNYFMTKTAYYYLIGCWWCPILDQQSWGGWL